MPFNFEHNIYIHDADDNAYPMKRGELGQLFIGESNEGIPQGVPLERHAMCFGTTRGGKGIGLIIPNLIFWNESAVVIDVKGEAANATAEWREKMGQEVAVIDPWHRAKKVPARLRKSVNLIDTIDTEEIGTHARIRALADACVMRSDPKAAHWDGGGVDIIAGAIDFMLEMAPPEKQTLAELREVLNSPDFRPRAQKISQRIVSEQGEERIIDSIVEQMADTEGHGLSRAAAAKILSTGKEADHFISVAQTATKWLDDPDVQNALSGNEFSLNSLTKKPTTVYLVIPPNLIASYGNFLRLFVQTALSVMGWQDDNPHKCLFILDEFNALGYMDEVEKGMGVMAGYGVFLFPILQNLAQLTKLYGNEAADSFISGCDACIFFGLNDLTTAEFASRWIGQITSHDIDVLPPERGKNPRRFPDAPLPELPPLNRKFLWFFETPEYGAWRATHVAPVGDDTALAHHYEEKARYDARYAHQQARYSDDMAKFQHAEKMLDVELNYQGAQYSHAMGWVGRPRVTGQQLMQFTARRDDLGYSENLFYFRGGEAYTARLSPYFKFQNLERITGPAKAKSVKKKKPSRKKSRRSYHDFEKEFMRTQGMSEKEYEEWTADLGL